MYRRPPTPMSVQQHANQIQRNSLFIKDPHCHWCRVKTHRFVGVEDDTLGTLDHVKSRPECRTYDEYTAPGNKVLACAACNSRRNEETVAKRLASGLRLRSALPREGIPVIPKSFPYGEIWDSVNQMAISS